MKLLALVALFLLVACSAAPAPVRYVNLLDECPNSPTYGQLIGRDAPVWSNREQSEFRTRIWHSRTVALLQDGDPALINIGTEDVYIAASLLSDYNPADGVRPDPNACAS